MDRKQIKTYIKKRFKNTYLARKLEIERIKNFS